MGSAVGPPGNVAGTVARSMPRSSKMDMYFYVRFLPRCQPEETRKRSVSSIFRIGEREGSQIVLGCDKHRFRKEWLLFCNKMYFSGIGKY